MAAALVLSLGTSSALAAVGDTAPGGATSGSAGMTAPGGQQQPGIQQVMKATDLLRKNVQNSNGEDIASVKDIAINLKTARVDYVILSTGGVLGAGDRMVAIPPQALRQGGGASAGQGGQTDEARGQAGGQGGSNQQLTLTISDQDLKSMKAVDLSQWDALSDPNYFRETYRAAGVQVPQDAPPSGQLAQASKLIGANAKDRQGQEVGEIEDVAVDLQNGRAPFAVISYGGILGMGSKQTAVPTPALSQAAGDEEAVTIAASENQIKGGKRLNEEQWHSGNIAWISDMYALYGVTPYWQTAGGAPAGTAEFASLDADGDGYISRSEAQQNQNLEQAFDNVDANSDGKLDEGEFAQFEAMPPGGQGNVPSNPPGASRPERQQSQPE